ncbi:MAG: hypothetical protein JSS82_10790 [Bacteroidetes bacterium]|nr:hypothetical protein [Bacteroidota bacterium]
MLKERPCWECDKRKYDWEKPFSNEGNGDCKYCHGSGYTDTYFDFIDGQTYLIHECEVCSGTGDCQGCNGTGWVAIEHKATPLFTFDSEAFKPKKKPQRRRMDDDEVYLNALKASGNNSNVEILDIIGSIVFLVVIIGGLVFAIKSCFFRSIAPPRYAVSENNYQPVADENISSPLVDSSAVSVSQSDSNMFIDTFNCRDSISFVNNLPQKGQYLLFEVLNGPDVTVVVNATLYRTNNFRVRITDIDPGKQLLKIYPFDADPNSFPDEPCLCKMPFMIIKDSPLLIQYDYYAQNARINSSIGDTLR